MSTINVFFKKGTSAAYNALISKDVNTFYYTTDTYDLYLGDTKLSNGADLTAAITRIAANEGDITTIKSTLQTIQGDAETTNSIRNIVAGAIQDLENGLASVATSGTASDVSVTDVNGYYDGTNVETILAEIGGQLGNVTGAEVHMIRTNGNSETDYSARYTFVQGGTYNSNTGVYDGSTQIGVIDMIKDSLLLSGGVVVSTDESPYYDEVSSESLEPGTYIVLDFTSGERIFVPADELVEYSNFTDTDEITFLDDNHNVTASIGTVNGSKLTNTSVVKSKLDSSVQASLDLADSSVQSVTATASTGNNGTITVDGSEVAVKGLGTAAYTATTAYDAAGSATDALNTAKDYTDTSISSALTWGSF